MKLIDVEEKYEPFDQPTGLAVESIASGKFKQYIPPDKPKPVQRLTWRACRGDEINGVLDPPFISYKCDGCSNSGQISGPTCYKTQVVRCCGATAKVPDDVAAKFKKLRQEYEPKHKRYTDSIRAQAEFQEKTRKAALEVENRRLASQLRMAQTDLS